jgi:hypothetical protein
MRRQGRKSTAGTGSIEGMGVETTTFKSALKKCEARARKATVHRKCVRIVFAPILVAAM